MKKDQWTLTTACAIGVLSLGLVGSASSARAERAERVLVGESVTIGESTIATWARVNGAGKVTMVGVTLPLAIVENPPEPGPGPAGAFAVLDFPEVVRQTTYFNHFELQAEPEGHPTNPTYRTPDRYSAPHFDFHFYTIPEEQVRAIPFAPPPLPEVSAELLPRKYAQPEISIPEMGRHAAPLSEFKAIGPLDTTMIAGFLPDASLMHFIEPMLGYDFLLKRRTFALQVPQPKRLGESTRYPSLFLALYDRRSDAYHMMFLGFKQMQ